MKNITKDWKTTVSGIVIFLLYGLNYFGIDVPDGVQDVAGFLSGVLLMISKDWDSTNIPSGTRPPNPFK